LVSQLVVLSERPYQCYTPTGNYALCVVAEQQPAMAQTILVGVAKGDKKPRDEGLSYI
jgi:hypothetical protein